ncbi:class I SAM-dependent methyltransferase [Gorillibacterium sp. sgz500922]|uniref:class I SAM-dependent methyltransferase n=1 Tax=Gorillibacterium sp. sgz500922 TaxID=3446694 RepID=UPI003F6689DD
MPSSSLIARLLASAKRPALFEQGTGALWTEAHLSEQMLAAHLDPGTDAASRRPDTIACTADWIHTKLCEGDSSRSILDLGCGPGLYAESLARLGHPVTGVDFSLRSIEYARSHAEKAGLPVTYLQGDYLTGEIGGPYDVILLIYCDFGVLSPANRETLLARVFAALKPGGLFLLDVFQPAFYEGRPDSSGWHAADSGFWRSRPYLCLESEFWYPETRTHVTSYRVLDEQEGLTTYLNWDQTFTPDELTAELVRSGFSDVRFYGDTAGLALNENSDTLCAVACKPDSTGTSTRG